MLKLVIVGVWVIVVTTLSTYASALFTSSGLPSTHEEPADLGIEELKSEMTSIPIIREGEVKGYLLLQLSFGADRRLLEERNLDPMPFLIDAAFRVVFTRTNLDVGRLREEDLDQFAQDIAREANQRIGGNLVRNVLFQQINYVKREDIRTNWMSGGNEEGGE